MLLLQLRLNSLSRLGIGSQARLREVRTPKEELASRLYPLAVSVFLTLNLGVPRPPLTLAMVDDPLQSLDDVNHLGLIDLFRRNRGRRQLLKSTHDPRFGNLLSRKLRPVLQSGRTLVIELEGWSRERTSVTTRETTSDPVALRLVS